MIAILSWKSRIFYLHSLLGCRSETLNWTHFFLSFTNLRLGTHGKQKPPQRSLKIIDSNRIAIFTAFRRTESYIYILPKVSILISNDCPKSLKTDKKSKKSQKSKKSKKRRKNRKQTQISQNRHTSTQTWTGFVFNLHVKPARWVQIWYTHFAEEGRGAKTA